MVILQGLARRNFSRVAIGCVTRFKSWQEHETSSGLTGALIVISWIAWHTFPMTLTGDLR